MLALLCFAYDCCIFTIFAGYKWRESRSESTRQTWAGRRWDPPPMKQELTCWLLTRLVNQKDYYWQYLRAFQRHQMLGYLTAVQEEEDSDTIKQENKDFVILELGFGMTGLFWKKFWSTWKDTLQFKREAYRRFACLRCKLERKTHPIWSKFCFPKKCRRRIWKGLRHPSTKKISKKVQEECDLIIILPIHDIGSLTHPSINVKCVWILWSFW